MTAKFMPAEVSVAAIEAEFTTIDAIPILSAPTSFATTTQNTKPVSDTVRLLKKIQVPPATVSSMCFHYREEGGGCEEAGAVRDIAREVDVGHAVEKSPTFKQFLEALRDP